MEKLTKENSESEIKNAAYIETQLLMGKIHEAVQSYISNDEESQFQELTRVMIAGRALNGNYNSFIHFMEMRYRDANRKLDKASQAFDYQTGLPL